MKTGDAAKVVMVVAFMLGMIALVGLIGMIWLVAQYEIDAATMAIIVAPASAATGGLATMLGSAMSSQARSTVATADAAAASAGTP